MPIDPKTGLLVDPISAPDRFAELVLGLCWLGAAYAIGMIFCATKLLARWQGNPYDKEPKEIGLFSILGAFLISAAWPLVLVALAMSGNDP